MNAAPMLLVAVEKISKQAAICVVQGSSASVVERSSGRNFTAAVVVMNLEASTVVFTTDEFAETVVFYREISFPGAGCLEGLIFWPRDYRSLI